MAQLKTQKNDGDIQEFLNSITDETKRKDSLLILKLMQEITGEEPSMWGNSIIGFGEYHYKYASGREGSWFLTGFSPSKQNLTLYIMSGFEEHDSLLLNLGKFKTGKSCLYINKLDDVDQNILQELIKKSLAHTRNQTI